MNRSEHPWIVVGGGIAGIAAAVELADAGDNVVLIEKRPLLGGRATSFVDRETHELIDNCQHVVLGCCTNVLDLFERLGVRDQIEFTDVFHYVERDGRRHRFAPSPLPAPLHYAPAMLRFGALTLRERVAVMRAMKRMMSLSLTDLTGLREATIGEWLAAERQPERAIRRFWEPIIVSAVNETLDRAAALPALQVFLQGFLPHRSAPLLGVPRVALSSLYSEPAARYLRRRGGEVLVKSRVAAIEVDRSGARGVRLADGSVLPARGVCVAVPPRALDNLVDRRVLGAKTSPGDDDSPITGVHVWLDRPCCDLPHAVLLDATVQWLFRKPVDDGARAIGAQERLQLVVSASRDLAALSSKEIAETAIDDLHHAFPLSRSARIVRTVVVQERHATFSSTPGTEALRPDARTECRGLVLAGDWTRSGWPATLEGAVRTGRRAAAILLGRDDSDFLTPDLERSLLSRMALRRVPVRWPTAP